MFDFLFAPENLPFMIALGVMAALGLLELFTAIMGVGLSDIIDSMLPDMDVDIDVDVDADGDIDLGDVASHGVISKLLGWLRIGRVPMLILLIVYLFAFGFLGLLMQSILQGAFSYMLPAWLAVWLPCIAALYVVHVTGGVLARIIPKDETEAVSERMFIGRIAVITLGKASQGSPAQARLKDSFGQTHYVMLEPDQPGAVFEQGDQVLIVRREGPIFRAIENTSEALVDQPDKP